VPASWKLDGNNRSFETSTEESAGCRSEDGWRESKEIEDSEQETRAKGRADRGRRESEGGKEFADDYFASGGGFGGGKVGRR
jgi:hypothetical protein